MSATRRLAAILAADVAGFSAAMERDEEGTFAQVQELRHKVIEPKIAEHQGRLIKTTGDGFLAEFASPIAATRCALAIQADLVGASIQLRIGLNLGDVIIEENGDVYGEGVNVAARLEALAEPGGILISGKVHIEIEGKVDATFEDHGEQQVKNIARLVRIYAVRVAGTAASPISAVAYARGQQLPLPDKPSIAVLPFQNMSGDPEQEYFADGMAEDIITALSRFKSLFVIARNSSFTYKGKVVDIKQVGRELGVRYVLEGSVRKAGGRMRITGQLIDSETGTHLWADRFDGSLEDVFDLQDEVTTNVISAIAPKVEKAEIERAKRKPVENLNAYDCFLRGVGHTHILTRESWDEARRLFYRAIELDPDFSSPYGFATRVYMVGLAQGWTVNRESEAQETRRLASRVSVIGGDDALALCWAGFALARVCQDYDAGVALVDRALSINQNMAEGWHARGWFSLHFGQHEEVLVQASRALRLNPLGPEIFRIEAHVAMAHFFLGRYQEASNLAAHSLARESSWTPTLRVSAAANALAGNLDEARNAVTRLQQMHPEITVSGLMNLLPYRRPQDSALMAEGLRLAGLPE